MTPKQQRFVQEYLIDLNATQAAIRAGFSKGTAGQIGFEYLKKPEITQAIKKAMDARAERTEISQDRVLKELARIGFADARNLMEWDSERVSFVPSSELSDDMAATVSSVKSKTRTTYPKEGEPETTVELEIKTYDKVQALTQIGRHLGMFTDKIETKDASGLTFEERVTAIASIFDRARERASRPAPDGSSA